MSQPAPAFQMMAMMARNYLGQNMTKLQWLNAKHVCIWMCCTITPDACKIPLQCTGYQRGCRRWYLFRCSYLDATEGNYALPWPPASLVGLDGTHRFMWILHWEMIFIWYSYDIHMIFQHNSYLRYVFKHWVKDTFPFLLLERVFEGLRVGICHNLLNLLLFQDPLGKRMRSGQTCYGKLLLKSWLTLWPWLFYHFQSPVYKNSLEVSDLCMCICSETYSGSSKLAGNEYMRIYICIYIYVYTYLINLNNIRTFSFIAPQMVWYLPSAQWAQWHLLTQLTQHSKVFLAFFGNISAIPSALCPSFSRKILFQGHSMARVFPSCSASRLRRSSSSFSIMLHLLQISAEYIWNDIWNYMKYIYIYELYMKSIKALKALTQDPRYLNGIKMYKDV